MANRILTTHVGSLPRPAKFIEVSQKRTLGEKFAEAVGPEAVIASTDCGLGGRVHPQIAWAKLKALAEGAELASKRLYSKVAA